jgi:hypothetical protein
MTKGQLICASARPIVTGFVTQSLQDVPNDQFGMGSLNQLNKHGK